MKYLPTGKLEITPVSAVFQSPTISSDSARNRGPIPLTVTAEFLRVAVLPCSTTGGSDDVVGEVAAFAEAASLAPSGGKATHFTVLVYTVDDVVDARVPADGVVARVDKDNLEVLVGSILVHPVGVEHTKVGSDLANTLFSGGAEVAAELQLVDTVVLGLTVNNSLGVRAFAVTTTDGATEDNIALLGLVSQAASLLRAGRSVATVDFWELPVFPSADTEQEPNHVGLLLAPEPPCTQVADRNRLILSTQRPLAQAV